jgi:hypothetical protein
MRKSLILSLVAALIAVAMPAFAGEGEFNLNLKSLIVGGRYVDLDSNSAKFNEYRDIGNGAAVPTLKIEGKNADLARWMMIELYNVGQRDARYAMFYDVSGKYSFALDYNKIPHRYMNDATLLLEEVSPGNFLVADPVQKSLQGLIDAQYAISKPGVNFAFLNGLIEPYLATAQRLDVGIQRDRMAARVDFGKSGNFGWGLEYKHENRTGSRPFGAAFGFGNVIELPEPIDYDIDDAKLGAEWKLGKGALRFGYTYSKFENNVDRLYWDNPFRFTDSTDASAYQAPSSSSVAGGARGFAALNPDNKRDGFYANGNWRFGKKTYLNFSLNEFNLKQNEALTPFTLNTSIGQGATTVTPLQLAHAYAAIANGGTVFTPELVRAVETSDGAVVQDFPPRSSRKAKIAPENLARITDALHAVVNEQQGTAFPVRDSALDVAGKTGTAQTGYVASSSDDPKRAWYYARDHAWFAAFSPSKAPEIAVVVLVEHGGSGPTQAAPVAMQIVREYNRLSAGRRGGPGGKDPKRDKPAPGAP